MLYCAMVTYMPTGGTYSPFHVPRSSFFVFHSRSLFPVLSFPFPVLVTPFKINPFCHIWLGMALRASFLAAVCGDFWIFHFLFPRVPLLPVLFIPGKRLLSRTFRKVFVFYVLFVSLMPDDCHQVPRDLKENELSLSS